MQSSNFSPRDAEKGAALYDAKTLRFYDFVVHGLSNHLAWRCPTAALSKFYQRNLSERHLDVGVGSGYFLDRCHFESASPRVSLLDLNEHALRYAAARIERHRPLLHVGNVLEPLELAEAPFDSIALMYLLHCVPGDLKLKASAFDHLGAHLADTGVLFGATILGVGVPHSFLAQRLMKLYNARQIFCNLADSREDLEAALAARFGEYHVETRGAVALFSARGYRRAERGLA